MRFPPILFVGTVVMMVALPQYVFANSAPVVTITGNTHVQSEDRVRLRAHVSDADQDSLAFHWDQVGGDSITKIRGTDTDTITFIAPDVQSSESYQFKLMVSDGQTNTESQTAITIDPATSNLTVDAGHDQEVEAGIIVNLVGQASGSDNLGITFAWEQIAGPTVNFAPTQAATSFIAPVVDQDKMLQFRLTASDGQNNANDEVAVLVHPQINTLPVTTLPASSVLPVSSSSIPVEPTLIFVKGPTTTHSGETVHLEASLVDTSATYFWRVKNYPLVVSNPYGIETDLAIPQDFPIGKEILIALTVYIQQQSVEKEFTLLVLNNGLPSVAQNIPIQSAVVVPPTSLGEVSAPESVIDTVSETISMPAPAAATVSHKSDYAASITNVNTVSESKFVLTIILTLAGLVCVLYAWFGTKKNSVLEQSSSHIIIYDKRK